MCLDTGNDGSCTGDLTATTEPDGTFLFISDQYADAPLLLEPGGGCIDTGNARRRNSLSRPRLYYYRQSIDEP